MALLESLFGTPNDGPNFLQRLGTTLQGPQAEAALASRTQEQQKQSALQQILNDPQSQSNPQGFLTKLAAITGDSSALANYIASQQKVQMQAQEAEQKRQQDLMQQQADMERRKQIIDVLSGNASQSVPQQTALQQLPDNIDGPYMPGAQVPSSPPRAGMEQTALQSFDPATIKAVQLAMIDPDKYGGTALSMMAKDQGTDKANLPAAMQLADEYDKARKSGDKQRMHDIEMFSKVSTFGGDDQIITPDNQNLSGEDFRKTISNKDVLNKADAMLRGDMPPPTINSRTPTVMKQALEAAQQIDPSFSAATFPVRKAVKTAFASGPESKNVNAINTVINHVAEWDKAVDDLHNYGSQDLNYLTTNAHKVFSDTTNAKVKSANVASEAVASEAAKAYRGVGAISQDEINSWKDSLSPNLGPKAREAVKKQIGTLLLGKLDALSQQWQTAFPNETKNFLSPKAAESLKKLGINVSDEAQPEIKDVNWVIKDGKLVKE